MNFGGLRICIPIPDNAQGGMFSFFRTLRSFLRKSGITCTENLADDYEILFVNSWVVPFGQIFRAKRRQPGMKVLHRVDGSARDYGRGRIADFKQARINTLVEVTVYQSKYSKYATRCKYPLMRQDGPVIHNPVDIARFTPDGPRLGLPGTIRLCHITFSTNKRKGADALFRLAHQHPKIDFILVGRYVNPPSLPNLHVVGYMEWDAVPAILRSCDALVTLSENEACPNVVLEALSSGLPVLYKASGGTPELVGECGAPVEEETFEHQLETVLSRRTQIMVAARERAIKHFSPEVVFPRYLECAVASQRRPLPTLPEQIRSWMYWPAIC